MRNSLKIAFLFLLWAFLPACNVIELDSPTSNSGDNTLVSGPTTLPTDEATFLLYLSGSNGKTWKTSQFTLQGFSGFQNCRLDDQMILETNGNYQFDGGNISCGGEDQAQAQGTWQLDFVNNKLTFVLGGETFQGEVTGLTESSLVIRGSYLGMELKARFDVQ